MTIVAGRWPRGRWSAALVALCAVLGLCVTTGARAASSPYQPGSVGRSIFYGSCGSDLPSSAGAFALIDITGGRAFYQNPCLVTQFHWAQSAGVQPSLVMNLNEPAGTTAFKALTGPKGTCVAGDTTCLDYNYGFNAAEAAFADANSQGAVAAHWWLDIEVGNSWDTNPANNQQVIQGAIDSLQGHGLSVGIYSSAGQWQQIAGSFAPGLPNWVAGASDAAGARANCSADHAFGGGTVELAQFPASDAGNMEYACGGSTAPTTPSATGAPPAPRAVSATALDAHTIKLVWTIDPATTSGVGIYDGNNPPITIGGAVTSYTVANLQPGTQYCFDLYAYNSTATSDWSGWSCTTTPAQ